MSTQQKKFNIRIPHNTIVIFSNEKKTLTIIGPVSTKSMKLKLKISIDKTKKILSVSPLPFFSTSSEKKKKIKKLKATTLAQKNNLLITQLIVSALLFRIN